MNEIKLRKIEIVSDFAHFKKPFATKVHQTYIIPPISTIVGILKNIFDDNIDDFVLGYTIEYENIFHDVQTLYKEVNQNVKSLNKRFNKKGKWISDIAEIDYLYNVKLNIYTNITQEKNVNQCLNLGKTDCLAKIKNDEMISLKKQNGIGYNQVISKEVKNDTVLKRITTETIYNGKRGCYDIYTALVRMSKQFEYEGYYDTESEQVLFLWNWKKGGVINEIK